MILLAYATPPKQKARGGGRHRISTCATGLLPEELIEFERKLRAAGLGGVEPVPVLSVGVPKHDLSIR
jgi:hypothetical protein